MNLQDVKAAGKHRKRRRIGRGPGSGWGCTAGRGNNGEGSRAGSGGGLGHEGGQMPIYRRMPKRGFTNAYFKTSYAIVNVADLDKAFPDGGDVDLGTLKACNLVKKRATRVKVLGKGDIGVNVKVSVDRASPTARTKIEAAGGSLETKA
jgi:large subunit ribosomal protein L15